MVNRFGWDAQRAVPNLILNPYDNRGATGDSFSAHSIMTGRIVRNGQEEPTNVYIKPHVDKARAQRDLNAAKEIAARGLVVPEPLGIYDGADATYLVSREYPGLRTLNERNWAATVADAAARRRLIPDLERGARSAARLHNAAATHGDYHPKNVAFGPKNEAVYIDLENAYTRSRGRRDAWDRAGDVYALGSGVLVGKPRPQEGLYYDKSPTYRLGAINELLVGPYMDALSEGVVTDLDLVQYGLKRALTTHKIIPFGQIVETNKNK